MQAGEAPKNESLYYSEAQLQEIMQKSPASFSTRLFTASTYSTAFIRLEKPDVPHAHGTWSEVFIVKSGAGVLETGGTITGVTGTNSATHGAIFTDNQGNSNAQQQAGGRAGGAGASAAVAGAANAAATNAAATTGARRGGAAGDLAGTGIDGGKRQAVKPGDVILIPAGVAHRWLQVDQPVTYLDIKFPKAE
jgi:mannose-6-phosphate isomerase-like protein (cupin superfamily)